MYTDTELKARKVKAETAFNLMMELGAHRNLIKADEEGMKPAALFPLDIELSPGEYIKAEDGETVTGVKFYYEGEEANYAALIALPDGKRIFRWYNDDDEVVEESEPCEPSELSLTWWKHTGKPTHITPLMQTGDMTQPYNELDGVSLYYNAPADSPYAPVPEDTDTLDEQGKAQLEAFLETANTLAPNVAAIQYCLQTKLLVALKPDAEIDGGIFVTYKDEEETPYLGGVVGSDAARILKLKNGMHRIELLKAGKEVKRSTEVSLDELKDAWTDMTERWLEPLPMDDSGYFLDPSLMAVSMD